MLVSNEQIQNTEHYKELAKKTPFLAKTLLLKNSKESIGRIVYQIQKMGLDYIQDKNYDAREVKISKQILGL